MLKPNRSRFTIPCKFSCLVSNQKGNISGYRALSLTWPAALQIHWNKENVHSRKISYRKKTSSVHYYGRCIIVLEHQYGRRNVMCERSTHFKLYMIHEDTNTSSTHTPQTLHRKTV